MVKKAEAIHLAEMIEEDMSCIGDEEIAKELRRLHDVNQELLEALKAVTAHLDRIYTHTEDYVVIVAAEKVIKKIEGAKND